MNYEHTNKLHRLRTLHLFAGAGGGILADLLLGHQPVCAVEINTYCQQLLHERQQDGSLPWFPIFDDVQTFDGKPWRKLVECVSGGFPCQDISIAGKGAGIDGARSGLWREFARVVREVQPRFVFVENSPQLKSKGLRRILWDLAGMGYDARWCVLGACDTGLPHKRKRIWILGEHSNPHNANRNAGAGRTDIPASFWTAEKAQQKRSKWESELGATDVARRHDSYAGALRALDGIPDWLERHQSLGNAQVPSVAALAWSILSQ